MRRFAYTPSIQIVHFHNNGLLHWAFVQQQKASVSRGLGENELMAKRNDASDVFPVRQQLSDADTIIGLEKFVRANVAEESIGIEQFQPALNEADINVEVAGSRRAIVRVVRGSLHPPVTVQK